MNAGYINQELTFNSSALNYCYKLQTAPICFNYDAIEIKHGKNNNHI